MVATFFLLLVLGLAVCMPLSAHAGSAPFEALKADHLLLRNRDAEIKQPENWRALAIRMAQARSAVLSPRERGQLLFMAGGLYADLAERFTRSAQRQIAAGQAADDASRALYLFREVAAVGGLYADDALERSARLYLALEQREAFDAVADELERRFPDSEFVAVVSVLAAKSGRRGAARESSSHELSPVDVVLDPGHGGEDLGAQGRAGLFEKDLTLIISMIARKALERRGYSVALTREGDVFLPLSSRTKIANARKARVFVSIHANASHRPGNRGTETYILDANQSANTQKLVERENRGAPSDLMFMLGDLIQREKRPESQRLAQALQRSVVRELERAKFSPVDLGVKKAPFFVLVGSHMPSALIEIGFIDHPEEGLAMGTERYRQIVGAALAAGIDDFLIQERGH